MEIWSVLLGWLLGIFSPEIVRKISVFYKKKSLKKVIIGELIDIKKRLSFIPFRILPSYGCLDLNTFRWTQEQTQNFSVFADDEEGENKLSNFDLTDEKKVESMINVFNRDSKRINPAFGFKKMELNILNSNLGNLEILDSDFLSKILEIKFQIYAFNEEIVSINDYLKMTFDSSISKENHQIITQEIDKKNKIISNKSMYIVEKINKVLCKYAT